MSGLSDEQIEQRLKALEDGIAELRAELRGPWGQVIAYLEEELKAARQEQARLDRLIGGLGELGE